jgi:predicted glycosyltransferase
MSSEKKLKLLFMINTPAQVHTWKNVIYTLKDRGHDVRILARNYEGTLKLLDKYGLAYRSFNVIESKRLKTLEAVPHIWEGWKLSKEFNPDIIAGFGVDVALVGALCRKPSIVFTDSEPLPVQHFLTRLFVAVILTPSCFKKDLGKKQIRFPSYKELAYLHPDYFHPDPSIYDELGISNTEKYVILRFNAFDALHDVGKYGFSLSDKYRLVRELEKCSRVFISFEGNLPDDFEGYKLPILYERIHHALYYAQLVVSDTQTITTETSVLGTPAIRCNSFVGPNDMGIPVELEQKYDLIYCFRDPEKAIQKAVELISQPDLKQQWTVKRQKLLADKIDFAQFTVPFLENYPHSLEEYRRKQLRIIE